MRKINPTCLLKTVVDVKVWRMSRPREISEPKSEVQNLIQKHQVLQSEIHSHDKAMKNLLGKAEKMIHSDHFASEDISETIKNLKDS